MNKKKNKEKPDLVLLIAIFLWSFLGFLILAGVSITMSKKLGYEQFYYIKHQLLFGYLPGIILAFIAYKINFKFIKKIAFPLVILAITLMLCIFLPKIGSTAGGAKRWVSLFGFGFQPSEFLKLSFIIYLSAWLSARKKEKQSFLKFFIPVVAIIGIICGLLIAQPDISTLGVISVIAAILYFCANTPIYHSIILALGGFGGFILLIIIAPYRFNRFLVFLRPNTEPLGMGYQIRQSLIAIGSGGILGQGLGLSIQKFGFLPQPMTDTIFFVFAEETGFIGCVIFILLLLIFAWQGYKVAKKANSDFLKLMAIGIVSWFILQSFVNIGAVTRILPLTGIPLPLVSYGSSHLIMEFIAIGLLLNISKKT